MKGDRQGFGEDAAASVHTGKGGGIVVDESVVAALVRGWIVEVLTSRLDVMRLAVRRRAKLEGWLKFELACRAEA